MTFFYIEMKAEDIELAIVGHFGVRANLAVPNASWGADVHECDLLFLTASGYLTEVEIKITKADLKKDAEKLHKHNNGRIRSLWFALPQTLFERDGVEALIPERAGILTVHNNGYVNRKRVPQINGSARPLNIEEKYQIARLAALRIWGLKERLQRIRRAII